MDTDRARKILTHSITNLEKQKGSITQGDLEAEIINHACLAILKNQNEKVGSGNSIKDILLGALNSTQENESIAHSFINAAKELLPEYFSDEEAEMVMKGIEQNLEWDGIWNFLKDYFTANHGIHIENDESVPIIFFSERQETFKNGILLAQSKRETTIFINFDKDYRYVMVKIDPDLPRQKGILISRDENTLQYKSLNKHYIFTIHYDEYDEVKEFIFEDIGRQTEIHYYE
ncbi:MAG: hypothetical protein ACOC1D_03170 [Prolixibacteraceae bacterium]